MVTCNKIMDFADFFSEFIILLTQFMLTDTSSYIKFLLNNYLVTHQHYPKKCYSVIGPRNKKMNKLTLII